MNIKALFLKYYEIISYLFFGGCTTSVSWGSYTVFVAGLHSSVAVGNCLSWLCATLFAFVVNKVWVFRSRSWKSEVVVKEFGLFFSSRLLTGALEMVSVPLLVKFGMTQTVMGVEGSVAKILVSILVVILNYVISKLVIFKNKKLDHNR